MTEVVRFKLTGRVPMLQNNPQMIDQNNEYVQRKKQFKKSDQGSEAYNRNDWEGGLYYDSKLGPYIPSAHIEASIANASSKLKNTYKKLFKASVMCADDRHPIIFEGKRTLDAMWSRKMYDLRNVKISGKGVIKCRPKFDPWAVEVALRFIPTKEINAQSVEAALTLAGDFHGLGDYLPKFGRFDVERV